MEPQTALESCNMKSKICKHKYLKALGAEK